MKVYPMYNSTLSNVHLEPDGHLCINGCFNWMIPNLYIGNGWKSPNIHSKIGCLGYHATRIQVFTLAFSTHFRSIQIFQTFRQGDFRQVRYFVGGGWVQVGLPSLKESDVAHQQCLICSWLVHLGPP